MKRVLLLLAVGWAVIFFTIVCFVDFDSQMQPLIHISDYLMTFHVAGSLAAHGQLSILYPPADSLTFAGMPFDRAAHALLAKMPASSVAEFMYMPLAAFVFVPFSFLPLHWSLFLWQLVSVAALAISVQCLWLARPESESHPATAAPKTTTERSGVLGNSLLRILAVLWLLPVCLTIWIGQVGLVFGMLPLSIGYLLLCRNKSFIAGLIWSLAVLKPQFLVPAFVVLFALLVGRQFRTAAGLCAGLSLLLVFSVGVFGFGLNLDWLRCLKISDLVYSDPRSGIATHIATSLPRTLILFFAGQSQVPVKALSYGLAAAIFGTALVAAWKSVRLSRFSGFSSNNLSETLRIPFLIGIFVTPLVMPHFFLYDYCLFGLTLPLAFFAQASGRLGWSIKKVLLSAWVLINIYSMIVLVAHQFALPLLFMSAMLIIYVCLIKAIWLSVPVADDASQPDMLVSK